MARPAYADTAYLTERRRLLARHPPCDYCGAPATEADHWPPISRHHHQLGGACGCRLRPSCAACARRQGAILGRVPTARSAPARRMVPARPSVDVDPDGHPPDDPVWDRATWLDDLRAVPADATWPRLMTPPHPDADGSYGDAVAAAAEARTGRPLRWWQHLAAARILEHDGAGRLVWGSAAVSVARQLGKSWLLAELAMWRIQQGGRFDAEQLVVHTGKDLAVCVEVQRDARIWARHPARADVWKVRESNGQQTVEYLADGSRWIVLASRAVQGRRASLAFVDEAWAVDERTVDEDLTPALSAQPSNQLVLVSTAHSKARDLMVNRRNAAVATPDDAAALWLEWSAAPDCERGDEQAWRAASPHWDDLRRQFVAVRYRAATTGHGDAESVEDDPMTSFDTQWLNRWPTVKHRSGRGEHLLADGVWDACSGALDVYDGPGVVALEEHRGTGQAAVAFVAADGAGRYEVDGRACDTWTEAITLAAQFMNSQPGARLIVGAVMKNQLPAGFPGRAAARRAGSTETGRGLAVLRALTAEGRVLHDRTADLDAQLAAARVYYAGAGGLGLVNNNARTDLLRGVLWALDAAQVTPPTPAVR